MEEVTARLIGFLMVLTRVSAFLMVVPVFGWVAIPVRIKAAGAVLISVFVVATSKAAIVGTDVGTLQAAFMIVNEAVYGFALGLIAAILFAAVRCGGHIVEREMGLTMAEIVDPLTEEPGQVLGAMFEMLFVLMFLSANGHHLFLLTISKSYEAFPAGQIPTIPVLAGGMVEAGSAMLIAGLRLAAPLLVAFMLLMVILAVLARVVPEMDILFTSFPLRIGLGLLMAGFFVPFISGFVSEFAGLMSKLLPL